MKYWKEIIEGGIYKFFATHREFGVPFPTRSLIKSFVNEINRAIISNRVELSYEAEEIPFEMDMIGGMQASKLLLEDILISGVNKESFQTSLASNFERFYKSEANIRRSRYASVSADEFVKEFCSWIVLYNPFK